MENRYRISYDLKTRLTTDIRFKQGDIETSVLEVTLFDNGIVADLSGEAIEFRFLKADNTLVYQDSTSGVNILDAPGGKVECVLKSNTLAAIGYVFCEVHRAKDGKTLTTPSFKFYVEQGIGEGIKSTNYISFIETKMIEWDNTITAAASNADDKAALANTAAESANTAATNADTKASLANEKALLADEKAALADSKASAAQTAADNANTIATAMSAQVAAKIDKTDGAVGTSGEIVDNANLVLLRNNISGRLTLTIEGNTLKNELTYNPTTWAEWTKSAGVVGDTSGMEFTADGISFKSASLVTNLKPNTKYALVINVVSNTLTSSLRPDPNAYITASISDIAAGTVGNKKIIFTTTSAITTNVLKFTIATSTEPSGNKIKISGIRLYELPASSQIETDSNTLTADQLAVKYPFHSGIWSIGEDEGGAGVHKVDVVSIGKNLCPNDSSLWELGSVRGATGEELSFSNRLRMKLTKIIKTPQSRVYTASVKAGYDIIVHWYNGDRVWIGGTETWSQTKISTIPSNAVYIRLVVRKSDDTNLIVNDIVNFNIQLEEGSIATTYDPYKEDKKSIALTQPHRRIPNTSVADIIGTDGILTRKIGKVIYDGSVDEGWSLWNSKNSNASTINTIGFLLTLPEMKPDNIVLCNLFNRTSILNYLLDIEFIAVSNNQICISILKSKLATQDVAGFKAWLASNNVTVLYELATPTVETVTAPTLKSFRNGSLQINTLIPPYLTILYPQLLQSGATMQVLFGTFASRLTAPTVTTMYVASDKVAGNADRLTMWDNTSKTWLQI